MQNLKRELVRAKEEVKRIQSVPLVIGQFLEIIDHNHGIVSSTTGSCAPRASNGLDSWRLPHSHPPEAERSPPPAYRNYYVRILSTINRELLKPGASVALHRHSNAVVDVLPPEVSLPVTTSL